MAFSHPGSPLSLSLSRRQAVGGLAATTALATVAAAQASAASPATGLPMAAAASTPEGALENIAYRLLAHEPERATSLGVDAGTFSWMRGRLEDQSQAGQDALAATMREDLAFVRSVDTIGFDADTRTSYEVVESAYDTALAGLALPYGDIPVGSWRTAPYPVIQNVGTYLDMPRFMATSHPLGTADDVDAYVDRMQAMPATLDGELARMQAARAMGVVPPAFLLKKAIAQMEQSIASATETYVQPLADSATQGSDRAAQAVERIVAAGVQPALERQLAELRQQATSAGLSGGMWAQPRGDEWYAWALRSSTTTRLTADEIHEQGYEELKALHAQMDPILRKIGYISGTVGERMQALAADPRYKFAEGDPGRQEIMAFIQDRIGWIKGQMPRAFSTLVDPNLEVRRLPLAEEPGAPGAYGGAGSKDGTIPGRFWINLRTTDLHRKYDLADLTYHETIPGHVWEGEYSNRLPLIRSILAFNAFSEGWALYAQTLADELGAYEGDEVGRLGYLQSLAFRACRMVVDTGLHHKRWSREKAVDFFVTENGSKREEVESEVDRYCSWPGQATGYKLGHSEIVRQRGRAEAELGAGYDFKAFNDAVVLGGNCPLDVMANNVSRYIASGRS